MGFSHHRPSSQACPPESHPSSDKEVYSTCLAYPTSGRTLNGLETASRGTQWSATSTVNPKERPAKRRCPEPPSVVHLSNRLVTPVPTDWGNPFGFRVNKPTPGLRQTAKQQVPPVEIIWRKPPATTLERLSSIGSSSFHNSRIQHDLGLAIQTPLVRPLSLQHKHKKPKSSRSAPVNVLEAPPVQTASTTVETCRSQAPEATRLSRSQQNRVEPVIIYRTPEADLSGYQESPIAAPDEWDGTSVVFESSIPELSSAVAAEIQEEPQAAFPPGDDEAYSVPSSDEDAMAQLLQDAEYRDATHAPDTSKLPNLSWNRPNEVSDPDASPATWISDLESDPDLFRDFWEEEDFIDDEVDWEQFLRDQTDCGEQKGRDV